MTNPHPSLDPVALAIDIRRGNLKLHAVPEAQRGTVAAVLNKLTDADIGVILAKREATSKHYGRTWAKQRSAHS